MAETAAASEVARRAGKGPSRGRRSWVQRLATAGVLASTGAVSAFVLRFNPTDRVADPTGPCLWHALTGINGPSCGGTRMFYYLLHGNIVQAARHHLVALVAVPFLVYAFIRWSGRVWFGVTLPPLRLSRWVYVSYGVAWLVYSVVLRNLSWAPFTWFDIPISTNKATRLRQQLSRAPVPASCASRRAKAPVVQLAPEAPRHCPPVTVHRARPIAGTPGDVRTR